MAILRNEQQAVLADLHARGEELLRRYAAVAEREDLPAGLMGTLGNILQGRRLLVGELAEREAAYDDLPKAGNQERAELESAVDRLTHAADDERAMLERLREADADWLEAVEQASQRHWSKEEAALLQRLGAHLRQSLQSLARTGVN